MPQPKGMADFVEGGAIIWLGAAAIGTQLALNGIKQFFEIGT